MSHTLLLTCLIFFFIKCNSPNHQGAIEGSAIGDKKIIAYVHGWEDNWGEHFEKANQITHINYAFANIKDGRIVEGGKTDFGDLIKLNQLKEVNPDLKILISVGGWGWSGNFSDAVLTEDSREIFANSAIEFILKHQIDGIDLDWEYPGLVGAGNVHRTEDKDNFTAILKLIREKLDALDSEEKRYLLTIATGAFQKYLDHTDLKTAHVYLDFINIMTYDFYTGGSSKTGHHANLKSSQYADENRVKSAANAVQQHVDTGIPINKIVLGVPFYGRWWKGVNPENRGLYQESNGDRGSYSFHAIADSLDTGQDFTSYWDEAAIAPYIWREKDSMFITYDNVQSMTNKVGWVKDNGLGGIMFWQLNGDDGSLLRTIFEGLN